MAYDFSGYATRNDIRCADGRVIRHDAFKDNDGETVPLVWQHVHDNPTNVLGHALLENRDDGVYCYGTFNNTESGQHAKEMVANGDITSMSIYANRLKQNGSDVVHGMIREVSLVLTGANPGAFIDNISFAHADGSYTESEEEAIIYSGVNNSVSLYHADDNDDDLDDADDADDSDDSNQNGKEANNMPNGGKTVQDVFDTLTDEQKDVVYFLIGQAVDNNDNMSHADEGADPTIREVFNTLTDEQKNVVYFLIGQAMQDQADEAAHAYYDDQDYNGYDDDYDGGSYMKHNVFEDGYAAMDDGVNVEDINEVLRHADSRTTSLKAYMEDNGYGDLVLEHSVQNLDVLYPEAKTIRPKPDMVTRNQEWVDIFWNGVKRTPFGRIKSVAANLTADAARAKGYIKATQKQEEVFPLFARETTPQTIYKKQKLDRDDIVDITDIDIVAWLKEELRVMLIEEICRAALVTDSRGSTAPDKINEEKIRPIYQDDDQYTIHYQITWDPDTTTDDISNEIVKAAVRARKDYRGSGGNLIFFGSSDTIADMMLREDKLGRRIYKDEADLAAALRVKKIIEVPVLDGAQRKVTNNGVTTTYDLMGLIVNPADYTFGTDKGGAVTLFDDFDIDFNQQKYLLETRLCGCLTVPFSAIAIEADDTIVNPT